MAGDGSMASDWGERGTCPRCGSGEVVHIVYGMPADVVEAPPWIRFGGCVVRIDSEIDRICEACDLRWLAHRVVVDPRPPERPGTSASKPLMRRPLRQRPLRQVRRGGTRQRGEVRLLSADGAAFALLAATPGSGSGDTVTADVELLTPDRLVRYLTRRIETKLLDALADAWLQAASERFPETSVASVQDREAGLAVVCLESSEFTVTLEFTVVNDLDADPLDYDNVAFEVPRSGLIAAAHSIREWLA